MPKDSFRITMRGLLYVTAVLATTLALFGWWGAAVAPVVLGLRYGYLRWDYFLTVSLLVGAYFLFMPSVGSGPHPPQRRCRSRSSFIASGVMAYKAKRGQLPKLETLDVQGRPMHSWRVMLLPDLGEDALFNSYRFDEPWDGPHNRSLLAEMPVFYRCDVSEAKAGMCHLMAVVGPSSPWETNSSEAPADPVVGDTNSAPRKVIFAESPVPVPWTKPSGVTAAELLRAWQSPLRIAMAGHLNETFWWIKGQRVLVIYEDGESRTLSLPEDRDLLLAGLPPYPLEFHLAHPKPLFKWPRLFAILSFAVLCFLPRRKLDQPPSNAT